MITFIFLCLSVMMTAFIVMICVQLLKIEKSVITLTLIAEKHIKTLYGKK